MTTSLFKDSQVYNSLILTSTQHLADYLSTQYPNAQILRLSQWLTRLCKPGLSESQENTVWQLIVAESVPYHSLAQQTKIAQMAQQAWHLLKQWNISLSHPAFEKTNDTRLFKQWAKKFIQICEKNNWLDASSAIELYIQTMQDAPKKIVLVGFTEFNPQQQRLLNALTAHGCQYEIVEATCGKTLGPAPETARDDKISETTQDNNKLIKPSTNDDEALIKRIALTDANTELTIMARWASHYMIQHPNSRIACIVPQLAENSLFIEDIFIKHAVPFTMPGSRALDKHPLIRRAFLNLPTDAESAQLPSTWAENFAQTFDDSEIQKHWDAVLSEFSALDTILSNISYQDAIKRFQILLNTTLFQPKTTQNPVHILSPTEAAGLPFDALWLMGAQDTTWPGAPRPNPFIPVLLQRELKMPYAAAEQTLSFYRALTTQLCTHTPEVTISYALRDDESPLRPSPLIQLFPEITFADLLLPDYIDPAQHQFETQKYEWIIDEQAPPASAEEVMHSGSALFKDQAACPFRAFARHRLGAEPLPVMQAGLTYAERGTLIHKILENIWRQLHDHTKLCEMSDPELKNLIQQCIRQALDNHPTPLKEKFKTLESARLESLMWQWLMLERKREFFIVKALEKKQTLQLGKYPSHIRIDRIDELADGTHIVIDYKTGEYSDSDWYGERPDEPQIPLYAVASEYPTSGASFAQIIPGKLGFKGTLAKSISNSDWKTQIKNWEIVLKHLAQQFESGDARVDPKEAKTCQYCHLAMVCRVSDI